MTAQRPLVEATALPLVRFVCSLFPLFLSTLFLSVLLLSPHFFLHPRFFFFYLSTFYSPPVYPQPPVLLPVKLTFPLLFFKSVIFPLPLYLLSLLTHSLCCQTLYLSRTRLRWLSSVLGVGTCGAADFHSSCLIRE